MTSPNAQTVTDAYEADGALTSATDWLGKKTTFTYDQNETWTGDTTPNAVTTTIAHDNPGRITSTTIAAGTTTKAANSSYEGTAGESDMTDSQTRSGAGRQHRQTPQLTRGDLVTKTRP